MIFGMFFMWVSLSFVFLGGFDPHFKFQEQQILKFQNAYSRFFGGVKKIQVVFVGGFHYMARIVIDLLYVYVRPCLRVLRCIKSDCF